ncbi:MAG: hypothetical protein ABR962_09455 [Candidatus Bathyarchaeia archaeon]|jgi:hypothetical protein
MMLWYRMEILTQQTSSNNDAVLAIIDKVLNQVFGKEATILIFRYMEHNYSLKRSEISDKIELFAQGLEDFLRSGAYVIERKILEDINSDCNLLRRMELENVEDEASFVAQMKTFMHRA